MRLITFTIAIRLAHWIEEMLFYNARRRHLLGGMNGCQGPDRGAEA
jgi:hypothetical protein